MYLRGLEILKYGLGVQECPIQATRYETFLRENAFALEGVGFTHLHPGRPL